ncbi:MAG: ATP-dependent zinc metalloprotease FtsH [Candidatus Xenobia bacterium]
MIIVLITWAVVVQIQKHNTTNEEIPYSQFEQNLDRDNIAKVTIGSNGEIQGKFKSPPDKQFHTNYGFRNDQDLQTRLKEKKVDVTFEPRTESPWGILLMQFLPYLLLFGFFVMIMRQAQSGGSQAFAFGRSRAKQLSDNRPKVTFEDVAGVEEAKEELKEVVDYLKYPKKYQQLGARIPKGVLLLGSPGTGKTLLGRAIAGEAGVPFYYISGSDFVEMFVGVGASRVRDLFEQAKKNAPCIVFVDEIDAVGRQRGAGLGGGHDEREQTLNQLLVEMDGFEPNLGVIILAATNRPDVLDPALLRPGRFDRHVTVDKPDVAGRKAILKVHARGKPLDEKVDLEVLARRTSGFSGADLENLLNEAALLAARAGRSKIEIKDCEEAIDRVLMGPEKKSRIQSEKERAITAYHEAGHTLVARLIPECDPVRKVTILPRGMSLGATWYSPAQDKYNMTRRELMANVCGLLGGRVAEEIVFGDTDVTTGASNDLERATQVVRDMVCKYGMSEKMGLLTFGKKQEQVFLGRDIMEDKNYSDDVAAQIDKEVRRMMDECYARTRSLVTSNRHKLEALVKNLLEKEVLDGDEVDRIMAEADRNGATERQDKPTGDLEKPLVD